jgi:hypothetical protein
VLAACGGYQALDDRELRARDKTAGRRGYPEAEVIRIVLDNLNIHSPASLYQAFAPEEARRITKKPEIRYTLKHTSSLNKNELAVLSPQCLNRRLGSQGGVRA